MTTDLPLNELMTLRQIITAINAAGDIRATANNVRHVLRAHRIESQARVAGVNLYLVSDIQRIRRCLLETSRTA